MAGVAFCAALVLAACGDSITSGTITAKRFIAAHDDTYTVLVCASYGQYGCSAYFPIIETEHYPDTWQVHLVRDKPKKQSGWVAVPQGMYLELKIGDYYDTKTQTINGPFPPLVCQGVRDGHLQCHGGDGIEAA